MHTLLDLVRSMRAMHDMHLCDQSGRESGREQNGQIVLYLQAIDPADRDSSQMEEFCRDTGWRP